MIEGYTGGLSPRPLLKRIPPRRIETGPWHLPHSGPLHRGKELVSPAPVDNRPRFAMKNNLSHPQFGQVLEHAPESRLIHRGQFVGEPGLDLPYSWKNG